MPDIIALIRLMRPLNLFQGMIALLVTASFFHQFPSPLLIIPALLIIWSYTGAGNALNDYIDINIDLINRPNRPIPSGKISRKFALLFAVGLFIVGTLIGIILFGRRIYFIQGIAMLLLISYSLWFKRLPLIGNIVVASILGMAFLYSAAVFGDIYIGITPALLAFGFTLIREIIKDMEDIEGDSRVNAQTYPILFGLEKSRNLVIVLTTLMSLSVIIPYLMGIYGSYYLLLVLIGVDIPLIFTIFSIRRDCSPANCHRLASLLKVDIFAGLLALYVGKY